MTLLQVYECPDESPLLTESPKAQLGHNEENNCSTFYKDVYHIHKNIPHSKMVNFKEESTFVLYNEGEGEEILEDEEDFADYADAVSEYLDELDQSCSSDRPDKDPPCPWSREPLKLVNSLDLDEYRYSYHCTS